jgi:pantoate kinase
VRKTINIPPVKLPHEDRKINLAFFSAIKTSSIISDAGWKKKVNAAGKIALAEFDNERDWDSFVSCSREFAFASGLARWCRGGMEKNPRASMAMVGRTLFSDSAIRLAGADFNRASANAYESGAELV